MKENSINQLKETTDELLQTISSFNQDQFNKEPFPNSWSAAQVAEHLLKADAWLSKLLTGNTEKTQREPDEKASAIKSMFLDFNTKLPTPEFIIPSDAQHEKETLYSQLRDSRNGIIQLAGSIDLSQTFIDVPFPGFGELTGIEWIVFVFCHTKRHDHQLKNIYKTLAFN